MLVDIFGRRKVQNSIPYLGHKHATGFVKAKRTFPCGYGSA